MGTSLSIFPLTLSECPGHGWDKVGVGVGVLNDWCISRGQSVSLVSPSSEVTSCRSFTGSSCRSVLTLWRGFVSSLSHSFGSSPRRVTSATSFICRRGPGTSKIAAVERKLDELKVSLRSSIEDILTHLDDGIC